MIGYHHVHWSGHAESPYPALAAPLAQGVGMTNRRRRRQLQSDEAPHAFRESEPILTALRQRALASIDNRGQVVGFALTAASERFSIYFQPFGSSNGTQTWAVPLQNGVTQELGTLSCPDTLAQLVKVSQPSIRSFGNCQRRPSPTAK